MDKILASAIRNKLHLSAFDQMTESRFYEIDLSALISNLFDVVPADALPFLAQQYGITGYNGWRYAVTEQDKRDLLKRAIDVHKLKGTETAIVEALKMINVTPVTILKGEYELYCNGEQFTGGQFTCGGENPFVIQVQIMQADFPVISEDMATDMVAIILTHKSARDYLVSIDYFIDPFTDAFGLSDTLELEVVTAGIRSYYTL